MARLSLSGCQAIVGLTAGLLSIAGGAYSAVQLFGLAPDSGEVVAVVREARTEKPLPGATVEIFTSQDAPLVTLTADESGRARYRVREGEYRLRVSHPRFGAEIRRVRVFAAQTAEVRISFSETAGVSPSVGKARRAVDEGISTVERFVRGLGL